MSSLFMKLKRLFYFEVASYFRFWAEKVLIRWNPTVILITGSSGKTTLLHLIESQLGEKAIYSHQANSTFGIPFHILGLKRNSYSIFEWVKLLYQAPFKSRREVPKEKYYIVEADAERPGEAESIASLVKPHIVIWLSLGQAHGASYDKLVEKGTFSNVFDAIGYEYGYCIAHAQSLVIANGDNQHILKQLSRSRTKKEVLSKNDLVTYAPYENQTGFKIGGMKVTVPALVPRDTHYAIQALFLVMQFINEPIDTTFARFILPPSRSTVFKGVKDIKIIDSTYNATMEGMKAMLDMFEHYPGLKKWLVLGDMLEQGVNEAEEHANLADMIIASRPEHIVLVGPRLAKHTYPLLKNNFDNAHLAQFSMPAPAHEYIVSTIHGGETILFKGARFLEGIVEKMLANPEDISKICRREQVWVNRRKKWGL